MYYPRVYLVCVPVLDISPWALDRASREMSWTRHVFYAAENVAKSLGAAVG